MVCNINVNIQLNIDNILFDAEFHFDANFRSLFEEKKQSQLIDVPHVQDVHP